MAGKNNRHDEMKDHGIDEAMGGSDDNETWMMMTKVDSINRDEDIDNDVESKILVRMAD